MNKLLFISLIFISCSVSADIYTWVDANGKTYFSSKKPAFSSKKPADQKAKKVDVKVNAITTVKAKSITRTKLKTSKVNVGKNVVMYSTTWCGYCKKARHYFNKNNIAFKEYDIENTKKGRRDYKRLSGNGVPIILVGNKRLDGFSESSFRNIYN